MGTYKITNITNLLGKRDYKQNSALEIDYVDGMLKKSVKLNAGDSLYMTVSSLPLSVHRLRVKKLISVIEVDSNHIEKFQSPHPKQQQPIKEDAIESDDESKKNSKKKVVKRN